VIGACITVAAAALAFSTTRLVYGTTITVTPTAS